jgi:hypothetical protein
VWEINKIESLGRECFMKSEYIDNKLQDKVPKKFPILFVCKIICLVGQVQLISS